MFRSTNTSITERASRLREIPRSLSSASDEYTLTVLCVPEARGSKAPPSNCSQWLEIVQPRANLSIQLLEFEYAIDERDDPIWQSLAQKGEELLDSLVTEGQDLGVMSRPMIIMSHSLGGIAVKRALTLLHRSYNPALRPLLNVQMGLVFLGTPHPSFRHRDKWLNLSMILRSSLNLKRAVLAQAEMELVTVATICKAFEECGLGMNVLSVFEQKPTKSFEGIFKSRKETFVDRALAEICLDQEELVGNDEGHHSVWRVSEGTNLFSKLVTLIEQAADVKNKLVTAPIGVSPQQLPIRSPFWASTASQSDPTIQENDMPPQNPTTLSPPNATFGSSRQSQAASEQHSSVIDFSEAKIFPKLPCYMMNPHSMDSFFGRLEVLEELDLALLPSKRKQKQGIHGFALCGLGGIGKTKIAIEFAHSRKHEFDAVFWVNADEAVKLAEDYNQIALKLQLIQDGKDSDRVVSRSLVLEWLSEPYKQSQSPNEGIDSLDAETANWLLILDNADDLQLIQDYLPIGGKGSVLITSRDPVAKTVFKAGKDLQPFSEDEAYAFLQQQSYEVESDEDRDYCKELVKRLGYLPLALEQIGSIITRRDLTFKEILEKYEEELALGTLHRSKSVGSTNQYDLTLATVWSLDSLAPSVRALLGVLALLDPDSITELLLRRDDVALALPLDYPSTAVYEDARTELIKASLVSRNRKHGTLHIHRVVQDVARGKMNSEKFIEQFTITVRLLEKFWPEDPLALKFSHSVKEWVLAETVSTHMTKLKAHYESRKPNLRIDIMRAFASLVARSGWYLQERNNINGSFNLLGLALEICEVYSEEMPVLYADVLKSFSSGYAQFNDAKKSLHFAERHFAQRCKAEEEREPGSIMHAMAYTELALSLLLNDRFTESIPLSVKAREMLEKTPQFLGGEYWPHFAIFHHAWSLIGLDKAKDAYNMVLETLKWREEKYLQSDTDKNMEKDWGLDPEPFKLAYTLQILGVITDQMGLHDESKGYFERALHIFQNTSGESYYKTNQVRLKLAQHYARLQQPEAALIMFDQTIQQFKLIPHRKAEYARSLFIKSEFLRTMGSNDYKSPLREAKRLIKELQPAIKSKENFGMMDFDKIVPIWSR